MTVVASLALSEGQFVLGRALAGTDARIELVDLVPVEEALVPYFWVTDTHDPDSFDERVRDSESTTEITRLDESADRTLYRLRWEETREDLFDALADNDILVEEGVRTDGEWLFQLRAPDNDALAGFRDDCGEYDISFDVRNLHYDPAEDHHPYGLTEKQCEAPELAFERGYFEVPRETTLTELAAATDVSQQAFSGRLQRAQRQVFARVFPLDD